MVGFNDVIRDHIRYGQKNINPAILFLDQKINLTGIIENADENRVKIQRIEMDLFEESSSQLYTCWISIWIGPLSWLLRE